MIQISFFVHVEAPLALFSSPALRLSSHSSPYYKKGSLKSYVVPLPHKKKAPIYLRSSQVINNKVVRLSTT